MQYTQSLDLKLIIYNTKSYLILNKALYNGTIFAPENFEQHYKISNSTGVVPLLKIIISKLQ